MCNFYDDEETLGMRVVRANREGNIALLKEIFLEKKLVDIFYITTDEEKNWLHRCNFNRISPAPLSVMEFYIKQGVPINAQDIYGMTPLHYAMEAKNTEGTIALLEAGANPNLPNIRGIIPLSLIGYFPERLNILQLMLDKGANVNHIINENQTIVESYKPREGEDYLLPVYELMKQYANKS
ncbi:ankyrin repeat domain-containing protein [Pelistega sp. NLN82]|uniref:Ankyrin repeat domain-containing protein n=1 Tax=Pelistega ratti TaxID=2652177 RepID=A0A6L9Y9Z6_9BURK|nr:ankyrin repeat domain-containing protein [Pelistega ratti]NEN76627.1 ankyrin repeat domain-containing protein [Pelistega ratti]